MLRIFTRSGIVQSRIQIIHNFTHNFKFILPYDKFGNHMYSLQDTQFLINSSRGHFYQSNIRAIHSRSLAYRYIVCLELRVVGRAERERDLFSNADDCTLE
uniref:Uncharacterized protein n=1 Tax=Trichogramma kaykai TaxID=54128 RepID=A0ABD2XQZ1_9HYME